MTVCHGTGRASLERAVARAIRRAAVQNKINRYYAWRDRCGGKGTEAYERVVEENQRLGIRPAPKRTRQEVLVHLHSTKSRRQVTMPGEPPKPKDERTEAEDRAIVAVEEVVKILSFHVGALGHIPNPNAAYRNRINQQGLFDLIRKLCFVVSPPLKMFNEEAPPEPRVPLIHVCIDCGGPATC